jgi:hypothetical protein
MHHAKVPLPVQSLAGDSCSVADQRIGPASSVSEIVRFGKRAQERFGDATRKGFYGITDTITALWWLRIGHQLGGDAYARAAKRMGGSRPTAFRIVHLYPHLDKIVGWAEDAACVQRQRRLTPTWPCVAEMLRRFPTSKGGSRSRIPLLEKLRATNLELTDKVTTLTGELAAAKRREAELRRTIRLQNAQIERLEKESRSARRRQYADVLSRVYKKPGPWSYWGYRPAPRPANAVPAGAIISVCRWKAHWESHRGDLQPHR